MFRTRLLTGTTSGMVSDCVRSRETLYWELGNGIYVSISINGSDTPVTRPEADKAGLSPRDRDSLLIKTTVIYSWNPNIPILAGWKLSHISSEHSYNKQSVHQTAGAKSVN